MQHLYAPWRGHYTRQEKQPTSHHRPFVDIFQSDEDENNFVLTRLEHHGIILNQYPYNPGHLLIIPYREVSSLDALTLQEQYEHIRATTKSVHILEQYLHNPGTNVGLNLGDKSSGGSVLNHIHTHVIPRWHGDTSFLPTIAETKVLSEDLRTVYDTLREPFNQLTIELPKI